MLWIICYGMHIDNFYEFVKTIIYETCTFLKLHNLFIRAKRCMEFLMI